jgi:immunity protein, SdpI family
MKKLAWLEAVLVITPFVVLAAFWNQIPERVPIHWNIRGEIDGWASKSFGLLITPIIGFLAVALCHVVSSLDPKLRANLDKTDRMKKVLQILGLAFAAFFGAVFGVQVAAAFGYKIAAARVITWCILLLFAILGNYLPNLRPNYFVGIRTPWTLERAETWRATHRVGGKLMFLARSFF